MKSVMLLLRVASALHISNAVNILSVDRNPFSARRKRLRAVRHIRYLRDVLKGEDFEIGEYTYGKPAVSHHPGRKLKIGKFCSIAWGVSVELHGDHRTNFVSTYPFKVFVDDWPRARCLNSEVVGAVSRESVTIGNDVWIGFGATILSGVTIGDGAVIGAKAVVTTDVEPYSVVAGNPARLVRKRFDEETIRKLLEIKWWDWPVEKINENLDIICSDDVSRLLQL